MHPVRDGPLVTAWTCRWCPASRGIPHSFLVPLCPPPWRRWHRVRPVPGLGMVWGPPATPGLWTPRSRLPQVWVAEGVQVLVLLLVQGLVLALAMGPGPGQVLVQGLVQVLVAQVQVQVRVVVVVVA